MEMAQVRYFLSVAHTLNFTRAAEECDVAQPSLSRAVKQLEAELGDELFRRERPQAILTELGHRMLPILTRCYESAKTATALAGAVKKGEAGALRIALSPTIDLGLVLAQIQEVTKSFGGIATVLRRGSTAETLEFLTAGEAEAAIGAVDDSEMEAFERFPLFDEGFVLNCGRTHRIANSPRLSFGDLRQERFVLPRHSEHAEALVARLREAEVSLERCHEAFSDADMLRLVADGDSVAVAPRSLPAPEAIVSMPLDGFDLRRTVCLFTVLGRPRSAAASMLVNLLRARDWANADN